MSEKFSELISDIIKKRNTESGGDNCNFEKFDYKGGISRERYDIKTTSQSKYYGKKIGRYDLISIPMPIELSENFKKKIQKILANVIKEFLVDCNNTSRILVVGLGNRHISADSLGSIVISGINVSIYKSYPQVMAICPSVMGLTGIETYDIVSGIVSKVKPTHLILIDSLCASSVERLGRSIQITNTGICPGSGIGNDRKCLDEKLAKYVISIGVPLLIYSKTFIEEVLNCCKVNFGRINSIMQNVKKSSKKAEIQTLCNDIDRCIKNCREGEIVTIKDIEECVKNLGEIISKSINLAIGVNFE